MLKNLATIPFPSLLLSSTEAAPVLLRMWQDGTLQWPVQSEGGGLSWSSLLLLTNLDSPIPLNRVQFVMLPPLLCRCTMLKGRWSVSTASFVNAASMIPMPRTCIWRDVDTGFSIRCALGTCSVRQAYVILQVQVTDCGERWPSRLWHWSQVVLISKIQSITKSAV